MHAECHIATDLGKRRQMHSTSSQTITSFGCRFHRCQDVPGLGHGVGLPLLAGLLSKHEVMGLPEPIQARH